MAQRIRNFSIIAHIDHGKSTLADRFLEITGTVNKREMRDQLLDQMDLERERGITIKLKPVRMQYQGYELNLIDTPGHVDFAYEVSRSLAAVEGAILLVDASQGIEAQTLANLYLALEQDLVIIPVINKIDLPNADVERVRNDLIKLIGCSADDILLASAKTGKGVDAILERVIRNVPPPTGDPDAILQILIFDSFYDEYRGVVAYGRVFNGTAKKGQILHFMGTNCHSEALDIGMLKPALVSIDELHAGEIGYITTGLKKVHDCRVGDTITHEQFPAQHPLPGYRMLKPMVFAGIYTKEGDDYGKLREAIGKIALNDAALQYEPDHSEALGFGFRCGFLGVLHLEIFQERLKREHKLNLVVTAPSVAYRLALNEGGAHAQQRRDKSFHGNELVITSPLSLPDRSQIEAVLEPWVSADVVAPSQYIGNIMKLVQERRGLYRTTEYLDDAKVVLHYEIPLASILVDFYDTLKGVTAGYASLNYDFLDYRSCKVARLDILVAEDLVEALATIVYEDEAYRVGRKVVDNLKAVLPRQMFEVKVQASLGGKIVAAARVPAMRKDVTAKLYGGDVTRKRKLLEKQKKGKQRMKRMGKVDIPQEAFLAVLRR
ncbi:MAG: translation elongation factor 4 [Patescibacteria group bacterium]|nr:translation elongation factor 4 [Patescibacteria group bacterium]MDD5715158.1 translation elongation factor 4 [Patescibacteria group bacterium]